MIEEGFNMKERLKQARKAAGKTQKEIAGALGITESTYCGYETGKRRPDALKIPEIARALDVSTDYLLGLVDDPTPDMPVTVEAGEEKELLALFRSMTEQNRAIILATARAIK